jgi:hypothetical protein
MSEASIQARKSDDVINCINETVRHLFNYGAYCLPSVDILDLGILLEYLKKKINSEYSNLSTLLPFIEKLQLVLAQQTGKHVFEGKNFYRNEIPHKEDDDVLKKSVASMGILFPFRKFDSALLDFIYETKEGTGDDEVDKYKVPSFLMSGNYAAVINKLLRLPQ